VIANSGWAERRCRELAGGSIRTEVVHLGADLPELAGGRLERPTLVTVAHLVARKRHAVVLSALASLPPERRPDYLIIGDGPGREPLARTAAELGLDGSVRFAGQLPHEQALAEAARCHLFVMPGVEEPFGVAFVEAMAAGLPAIGGRGEGGPEDIAAAGPGLVLVPPDDHVALAAEIDRLLADPAALAGLGVKARETVERAFTWERCGEATVAAYERALA
jgi:glycosyltransferase involved in cell wall biosynthesis